MSPYRPQIPGRWKERRWKKRLRCEEKGGTINIYKRRWREQKMMMMMISQANQTKQLYFHYSLLSCREPNHQPALHLFFCPRDNWNGSSIIISSHNAFITSSAQKSSQGIALSFTHHIIHPFICSSYRWHIVGLFHDYLPVTTHSCLPSFPNCVVVMPVVVTT